MHSVRLPVNKINVLQVISRFTIYNVLTEDQGIYRCNGSNTLKDLTLRYATTFANLTVTRKIETRSYIAIRLLVNRGFYEAMLHSNNYDCHGKFKLFYVEEPCHSRCDVTDCEPTDDRAQVWGLL